MNHANPPTISHHHHHHYATNHTILSALFKDVPSTDPSLLHPRINNIIYISNNARPFAVDLADRIQLPDYIVDMIGKDRVYVLTVLRVEFTTTTTGSTPPISMKLLLPSILRIFHYPMHIPFRSG